MNLWDRIRWIWDEVFSGKKPLYKIHDTVKIRHEKEWVSGTIAGVSTLKKMEYDGPDWDKKSITKKFLYSAELWYLGENTLLEYIPEESIIPYDGEM